MKNVILVAGLIPVLMFAFAACGGDAPDPVVGTNSAADISGSSVSGGGNNVSGSSAASSQEIFYAGKNDLHDTEWLYMGLLGAGFGGDENAEVIITLIFDEDGTFVMTIEDYISIDKYVCGEYTLLGNTFTLTPDAEFSDVTAVMGGTFTAKDALTIGSWELVFEETIFYENAAALDGPKDWKYSGLLGTGFAPDAAGTVTISFDTDTMYVTIKQTGGDTSDVYFYYELDGNTLTLTIEGDISDLHLPIDKGKFTALDKVKIGSWILIKEK
jgi:hypothetical protein